MNNVLIIEDESLAAIRIENYLIKEGYTIVDTLYEPINVYERAIQDDVDIILMDINLTNTIGDISGINIAHNIRKKVNTPIIFLTGYYIKETMKQTITIPNTGYLNKPFKELELLAQLENFKKDQSIIKLDNEFQFCMNLFQLKRNSQQIKLNKQQIELLIYFIQNKNKLLTNEELEQEVWKDKIVQDTTRVALISKLRTKLDGKFIVTSHGFGYIFKI